MTSFLDLLRGESFSASRPPTPSEQKELYRIHDETQQSVRKLILGLKASEETKTGYIDPKKSTIQWLIGDYFDV